MNLDRVARGASRGRRMIAALAALACVLSPLVNTPTSMAGEKPTFDPAAGTRVDEPLNADELTEAEIQRRKNPAADREKKEVGAQSALGPELKGFDLQLLRSGRRVENLRFTLEKLRGATVSKDQRTVWLSLSLEFGRDSGLAEAAQKEKLMRTLVCDLIGQFSTADLLTVGGKLRLKESIIGFVNKQLATARVRQVYFTDFRLLPSCQNSLEMSPVWTH